MEPLLITGGVLWLMSLIAAYCAGENTAVTRLRGLFDHHNQVHDECMSDIRNKEYVLQQEAKAWVHAEAVKNGFGRWIPDANGKTHFQWNQPTPSPRAKGRKK